MQQPLPSVSECERILVANQPEPAVLAHSVMVARVGLEIARAMARRGARVNLPLVAAGCMLHDVCKLELVGGAWRPQRNHAQLGAALVTKLGFPQVAPLVLRHVLLPGLVFSCVEEEIVFYSDKRVDWDEVVPIDVRFERLLARYRDKPNVLLDINETKELTASIEKRLLTQAGLTAGSLSLLNSFRGRGLEGLA